VIRSIVHRRADANTAELPDEGRLASFQGASAWFNSDPQTPEGLLGRVVVVDFWTYTCVNWLRTLPYVRACIEVWSVREQQWRNGLHRTPADLRIGIAYQ
jgi:hypothetical protein